MVKILAIAVDKPELTQLVREIDKLNADIPKLDYSIKLSDKVEKVEVKNEQNLS